MLELVLFSLPTVAYLAVQTRRGRQTLRTATSRAGIAWGSPSAYGWALLLLVPLAVAAWSAFVLIPAEALDTSGVSVAQVTSLAAVVAVVLRVVGEELLFRGLLGGVLFRRLGFWWGNLLQSLLFLLPHLAILVVDVRVWPILPVQFTAGWLLGWLRHETGSFVPGAVVHVIANVSAGLVMA